jgi:hypothetical protein
VIGAAKCGTTSLHEYLDAHPEISMSRRKELDFFVPDKNPGYGLDWYESQFDDAPVRGESSPSYSVHPYQPGVPERIHAVIPDVRLVYLVRDPIERIVSHYVHRSVNHPYIGSLEQALADSVHGPALVAYSRYWHQLEQYLAYFSPDQILVVDSDELGGRRDETLRRIFRFLGVDADYRSPDFAAWHNPGVTHGRTTRTGQLVLRILHQTLGTNAALAVRRAAPAAVTGRFRTRPERPVPSPALRARLEDELREDVERLRAHTGLALSGWSI